MSNRERLRLGQHPDLLALQKYVQEAVERNGSPAPDSVDALLKVTGQLGFLAKAIRIEGGLAYTLGSKVPKVDSELAGLLFEVVHLANNLGIDLESAFKHREVRYRRRKNRDS